MQAKKYVLLYRQKMIADFFRYNFQISRSLRLLEYFFLARSARSNTYIFLVQANKYVLLYQQKIRYQFPFW